MVANVIKWIDLNENDEVWACAYSTTKTEKNMALKQKPVYGIIKKDGRYLKFFPYNKQGKIIKSKGVGIDSRTYTRTENEAIQIYNSYVQKQIAFLEELINNCKSDLI